MGVCVSVRLSGPGSVHARISAEWGALPAAPPAWKKSLLLSAPTRGARTWGRAGRSSGTVSSPGSSGLCHCAHTRKLRFPPARRPEPRQRHPPVPARTSGTSERQESPLGERGTKEPQADAFETKFICLPRAQAPRWGCTGQRQECERRVATLVCSREPGAPHGFRGPLAGGCRISLSSQAGLAAEKRQVRELTVPWGWETPPLAA